MKYRPSSSSSEPAASAIIWGQPFHEPVVGVAFNQGLKAPRASDVFICLNGSSEDVFI